MGVLIDRNYTRILWSGDWQGQQSAKELGDALKNNSSITTLALGGNNIGAEGAKAIAEGLKHYPSIRYLYLWGSNIGAEGAKAIAESLKYNSSLTHLRLHQNQIGDEGAKAIADSLKSNSNISITDLRLNDNDNNEVTGATAEILRDNAKIRFTTDSNELFSLLQKRNGIEEFILVRNRNTSNFPIDGLKRWLKDDSSKDLKTLKIITEDVEVTSDLLREVCCDRVDLVLHLNGKNIELSGIKKAILELANAEFFDVKEH